MKDVGNYNNGYSVFSIWSLEICVCFVDITTSFSGEISIDSFWDISYSEYHSWDRKDRINGRGKMRKEGAKLNL